MLAPTLADGLFGILAGGLLVLVIMPLAGLFRRGDTA
jgi:hypothetical protein